MTSEKGLFITFEGPEGAGKTTQVKLLARFLRGRGLPLLVTREPGGTAVGQKLRRLLLDSRQKGFDPFIELCLYEAARAALVSQVIRPALKIGKICLVDRFQDSTWVYQGWAGKMSPPLVEKLGQAATQGLDPDATILLDLPAERGLARATHPNRMEEKPISFHRKVRSGYLVLAKRFPGRFHVIGADAPLAQVQQKIRKVIEGVLEKHRRA